MQNGSLENTCVFTKMGVIGFKNGWKPCTAFSSTNDTCSDTKTYSANDVVGCSYGNLIGMHIMSFACSIF